MTKRLSVILGAEDEQRLAPFLDPGSAEHAALQDWMTAHGLGPVGSEAAAIRALMRAGATAIADVVLDLGYAQLAAVYEHGHADAERRSARDRYVERTEAKQ